MIASAVEDYIPVGEAARRAEISTTFLKRKIETGEVTGMKTKLGWLVNPESVEAYARRRAARREKVEA